MEIISADGVLSYDNKNPTLPGNQQNQIIKQGNAWKLCQFR